MSKPKRTVILEAILEGGKTRDDLIEIAETTTKGLSSQFTYLRMMGKCPLLQEDGTYTIVTAEEWEAHREAVRANAKTASKLSPEDRFAKATARLERAVKAQSSADKRCQNNIGSDNEELYDLQLQKCEIEYKIATIEVANAQKLLDETPAEQAA